MEKRFTIIDTATFTIVGWGSSACTEADMDQAVSRMNIQEGYNRYFVV